MIKSLVALAILSVASTPVMAQTAPEPAQPTATPQMIKKQVCEMSEADSYSRLGIHKVCHTVEVPAPQTGGQNAQGGQQTPAPAPQQGN